MKDESLSDAQSALYELSYAINHPDEHDLTEEQILNAKREISEIRAFLAKNDEAP